MAVTVVADGVDRAAVWRAVTRGGAAMVAAMGVGRFAFTPILPMMHDQAGMSTQTGALLATGNYLGYFVGALAVAVAPRLLTARMVWRVALVALIATLAAMPLSHSGIAWFVLRTITGVASALIMVMAIHAAGVAAGGRKVLTGWAFGGVGVGIAASGVLVLALSHGSWESTWVGCAVLGVVCVVYAWPLVGGAVDPMPARATTQTTSDDLARHAPLEPSEGHTAPESNSPAPVDDSRTRSRKFAALMTSYSLQGVGYIIAGTFLVAAVQRTAPAEIGNAAWILVGLAAFPSTVLWTHLAHRHSPAWLLIAALLAQAVGMALPALMGGMVAALISAVLFGATFMGIVALAAGIGGNLRGPRALAVLTTGYAVGQVVGPLLAAPLLHSGYRSALLLGSGLVVLAAIAALGARDRR
ncbi:YbfB/YjiJ family MFS transporter [Nocardia panacis]|nr:YbfB/YjiJ family MFS transporter [Nocardia panacis]